jgi:hypothetical protein
VVRAFLMGCAVPLVLIGCAGVRTEAPKEKQQGHTAEATASEERAGCEGTRTIRNPLGMEFPRVTWKAPFTTNDLPECPNKGGLLLGTDGPDELAGEDGDDEVRGRGDKDVLGGGAGDDVIYGGPGDDTFVAGEGDDIIYGGPGLDDMTTPGPGEDEIHGGDGDDVLDATFEDADRDRLYCGKGKDYYAADKKDYVDGSCEKKGESMWGLQ